MNCFVQFLTASTSTTEQSEYANIPPGPQTSSESSAKPDSVAAEASNPPVGIQEVESDSGYVIPPNFAPTFDSYSPNPVNGEYNGNNQ